MAKNEKITLTLDFNVERAKLQEVGNLLGKDVEKGLRGTRTIEYFNSIKTAVGDVTKTVGGLYSSLSKPLVSKSQARELTSSIESAFKGLDSKLLSLQGNITKTFNSIGNAGALKQIRVLGEELDKLTADYEAVSQLFSKSRALGNKNEMKSQLSAASKEMDALAKKQTELTAQEKKQQEELKQTITEINKKLEEKAKIQEQINVIHSSNNVSSQTELSGLISGKMDEQQGLINGSISIQDVQTLKTALSEIRDIIQDIMRTSNATGPKVSENIDDIIEQQRIAEEQAKTFKSVMRDLGIPMLGLHEIAHAMRRIVSYSYEYIKNLDRALTEIAIVSGKSRQEVLALTDTFIELSAKTGMAIDDIAKASTIFYQQGLNDEAVKKMTEYTAIFAKISSETVEVAADQITAAINGFNLSVDQAGDVIDKLSVLAAYSAADIDELATAMSKAASQANMAGLSFDQYNAYLATMIEVTREAPENIGTSLKTIMSRFQSIKSGDNTEDDTDVNAVEKALKSVGVQLRDAKGQLRDLGDVLEELGPKWNGLDRNTQAYLGTVIAGTRQQSRFMSLMQNWDRALELTTASQNSAGAATRMHQSAMEGLDAALNNLTNAWQKLISNLANGDSFKWLVNTLSSIVKWFADGNSLLKIFTVAITLFNAKTLLTNMSLVSQGKELKNLDTAYATVSGRVKTLGTNITSLLNPMSKETAEIEKQIQKVRTLTQEYNNLTNAKNQSAGTSGTNPTDVAPTGGTTGSPVIPDAGTIEKTAGATKNLTKNTAGLGTKMATAGKNVLSLVGYIQTGIMAGMWAASIAEQITDWLTTTADEMKEKAQEAYGATRKEMDKRIELIDSVEANLAVYDRLSKKLNKSTEEVEQLAKAADELAKAVPESLIGYDANGNPIINTNEARAAEKNAREELAEYAKEQMGNIGNLARADIREIAEKNVANSGNYGAVRGVSTAGMIGGYGAAAGIATFGAINGWNPVGWGALIVAGIVAIGSTIAYGVNEYSEQVAISAEELRIAQNKAKKVYEDYNEELLKNMSYITQQKIKDRTVDGASQDARITVASYIGSQWLDEQTQKLFDQLATKEITEEEYEEKFANLGEEWSKVLDKIDDRTLASAYKSLDKIAEGIGDKTYASVESAIDKIIKDDMGISEDDELFKTIKEGFMKAAYSGFSSGIYAVVKDLEGRKATDLKQANGDENSEEYKRIEAMYNKAIDNVKNKMTNNQVSFYDVLGLTDDVGLFNQIVDQYADTINNALARSNEAAAIQAIAYLDSVKTQAEQKMAEITDKESQEYKAQQLLAESAAASIEKAWNSMDISIDIPWKNLWEDFEKMADRTKIAWESVFDIKSENGMDPDQWKNFTKIFDDINFDVFDDKQLLQYANALDTIADSLTVVNGQIYANGEAVESIAQLEEQAVQASIEATRQELINKQLELEASKSIIDAQVATLEWKIKVAEGSADAEQFKSKAEEAWLNASNKMNTFFVQNQGKVAEAMVRSYSDAFTQVAVKFNQLQTAMANGQVTQGDLDAIGKYWKDAQKSLNFNAYSGEVDKIYNDSGLAGLKSQLEAAKKASASYQAQISNINLKLATLDSGLWTSKNGVSNGSKGNEDKIQQYIGKLKEIYNILNRIAVLEHRLSTLDSYADIAQGQRYGSLLKERVKFNQELLDQYEFLTKEQKQFTNGYKDFIKSVPGLEDVFDFDKYGQIIINWDKYVALQDKAAKGETTLKEKADDVYETYTQMFEDLQGYFDKTIDYYKEVIKLQQEMVDNYISIQNEVADAVKEIYQKILDTKLDAIDQEKEAIEELRKAREQDRRDQENAKAVSGLQTNLQRAMMDTSGASDVAFLKAQEDIEDKLEDIAEDKYSRMLDDIIDRLEEEKDSLQDNFDQMFDQLDWLFQWIDEDIMGDESMIYSILQQTDEWNQSSFLERQQKLDDWQTKFYSYYDSVLGNDEGIYGIYKNITNTKERIGQLDANLTSKIGKESADIQQTILKWQNNVNSAISSAVSAASSGGSGGKYSGGGGSGGTAMTPGSNAPTADNSGYTNNSSQPKSAFNVGDKVKTKENGFMAAAKSYTWTGSSFKQNGTKYVNMWGPAIDYFTIGEKKYWDGKWWYKINSGPDWYPGVGLTYKKGGFADYTGPAWLDGTKQHPEAVLNALQTEHFIKFTNALDNMYGVSGNPVNNTSSINIESIAFNVDSMSSPEDGERAFNMFVNKFKEIGNQTGIKINSFKNTL